MTQAAEFTQTMIGDFNNSLVDISANLQSANLALGNTATDVTTFAAAGGPVAKNSIRGAETATVSLVVEYDPTILGTLEQIWGARGGSTVQGRTGKNTLPGAGDMLYQGTFTLFKLDFNINAGQLLTVNAELKPTDGGALVPGWYPY